MGSPLSEKKRPKPLIVGIAIAIIAILIGAIALLYHPYVSEAPTQAWLEDPENDVELIIGEEYPGIIDITHVSLEVNEGVLKLTITVRDSVPEHLNNGEYAQWMATIILQDGLFKAYEVYMEMNSTKNQGELVGYFREIGEEAEPCTVERDGNSLIIFAPLDGLQSAREIEWSIQTWFEKLSDYELINNGIDYAPNEGFQRTILK